MLFLEVLLDARKELFGTLDPVIDLELFEHFRRPSDDAGDEGGISDWVSLNLQATDPMSHTPSRVSLQDPFLDPDTR